MRILSEADIAKLIRIEDAMSCARAAFAAQAAGTLGPATRGDLRKSDSSAGCLLLAGSDNADALAIKSNVFATDRPPNPRRWASLLTLWDWRSARPRALLSSALFNEHRTAAGFAVGIDRLSAPTSESAVVIGPGKSAPLAARYLVHVRPMLKRLILVGRTPHRVHALQRALRADPAFDGLTIEVADSSEAAVADTEIVVTITTSDLPVFPGEAVPPGACIVLGGANRPTAREADDALMRRADLYVDSFDGARAKAGDVVLALQSGALVDARVRGEIGGLGEGQPALSPGADVRVFKSIGLPIQDVVLAHYLVSRAEAHDIGTLVDLEGGDRSP